MPVDKIKEIVFCYNGSLDTQDELSLLSEGQARGVKVRFRDLDKIASDLFDKYPGLAKEFLNVEVDSGQVVGPQEFVSQYSKSSFATRLDTAFHFREEELKRVATALETTDPILITGPAGVGKSRFMLEVANRYSAANEGWTVKCVFNRGVDLSQDLKVYFRRPGKYLILVDDANRLSGFEYVLQLLHDQTSEVKIKIIATVRDYARERILEQTKPFGGCFEEQLKPFTDEQIRKLISDEEEVKNYHFATRIVKIARGNPRLAMMAAKLAVQHQSLEKLSDVTSLYDEYFGSVRKVLEEDENERMVKVAGIVSFFRIMDRSNNELMQSIAEAFDIPPSAFWHTVEQLDRLEILDLYEHEVVKFSDQVLATYLFYFAVFKSNALDFSIFLDRFFPRHRSLFVDALNPVINSLGAHVGDQLRPHVEQKWNALEEEKRDNDLVALAQAFWFVRPTETLLYIRGQIKVMPTEQVDVDSLNFRSNGVSRSFPLLDLLGAFRHTGHFKVALELILEAFAMNNRCLPNVLHILKNDFGFAPESYLFDFVREQTVMDVLWARTENSKNRLFTQLFLAIASHYLHTHFRVSESQKMSVSFTDFELHATPELISLRRSIWEHVLSLYSTSGWRETVLGLLHDYSHSGYQVSGTELLASDAEVVIPFMMTELDPDNAKHVLVAQDYLGLLDDEDVAYAPEVRGRFTNEVSHLVGILFVDKFHRDGRSFEKEEARRDAELRAYVEDFAVDDYKKLLRQCVDIQRAARDVNKWELQRNIGKVFNIIEEKGAAAYAPVVDFYLELGAPFNLNGRQVAYNLIRLYGTSEAHKTISGREYPERVRWLFDFFATITQSEIKKSHLDELYSLYRTASPNDMPNDFEFLERYRSLDEHIVLWVIETLLVRMEQEQDRDFAFRLSFLFNPYATTSEQLMAYFGIENLGLLKKAYLAGQIARDHVDHNGRVFSLILDYDNGFLREYITVRVTNAKAQGKLWLTRSDDSMDFSFLWRRNNFEAIMTYTLESIFDLEREEKAYIDHYLEALFRTRRRDGHEESDLTEPQVRVLGALIAKRSTDADFMEFLFRAVGLLPDGRRRDLLAIFLRNNARVEDFKRLSLEPMASAGWSGSAVPYYQKKMEFAESLLPLLDGIDFLEHRFHIEKWVESFRRIIEMEKRRDFMRDW